MEPIFRKRDEIKAVLLNGYRRSYGQSEDGSIDRQENVIIHGPRIARRRQRALGRLTPFEFELAFANQLDQAAWSS
jgi:hypothetical protein